ncbi:flagellar hook-basal body complex protein FliE [Sedimentibacter sp. zth1]|uniref:flagellar hook-basal body complex protein FliE n=1 Tax=Sedimentibacter sp. zth1 TaxID=2816908 RepID=UPI001A93293A|nr:flagellar hook-basal body complex protein FliE [Sedimentibacter sp. zth1]QSX07203.1 flagellar hook-basal body complex protein FliE [Sedimentibacter sp. zth1]
MIITPINKINGLDEISKIGQSTKTNKALNDNTKLPFSDIFSSALNDYKDAENQVNNDIYELSTGQSDDLHNLMINTKKAEMSLDLFIQIRNKALEAYKELIGMGI